MRASTRPPAARAPVRYEYRKRGQPRWVAYRYDLAQPTRVRVTRSGANVLETTVE